MIKPNVMIGRKYVTPSGNKGVIVALEAYQKESFLGHTSFQEVLDRKWGCKITVMYETDSGDIRSEVVTT